MNFLRSLAFAAVAASTLFAAPHAFAQGREMNIGDQPGYIPDSEEIDPRNMFGVQGLVSCIGAVTTVDPASASLDFFLPRN